LEEWGLAFSDRYTSSAALLFLLVLLATLQLELRLLLSDIVNHRALLPFTCLTECLQAIPSQDLISFGHTIACFGTDAAAFDAVLQRKSSDLFFSDFKSLAVGLIPDNHQLNILLAVLLDFVKPKTLHVLEGLVHLQVEHHHDPLRALVVRTGNSAESFLSRRVPNLQFYLGIIDLEGPACVGRYLNLKSTPMVAR
jgi:hypothetical protein